jgi:hypothetical protein
MDGLGSVYGRILDGYYGVRYGTGYGVPSREGDVTVRSALYRCRQTVKYEYGFGPQPYPFYDWCPQRVPKPGVPLS